MILIKPTMAFVFVLALPCFVYAQRGGGGGCHSNQTANSYNNTQSYLSSGYSPQSYMNQNAYQQQAYMQQQMALMKLNQELAVQAQEAEARRVERLKEAAAVRKSKNELARQKRAQKAADRAANPGVLVKKDKA
jgi:hypothetical protein